jgi:hypothetical protein
MSLSALLSAMLSAPKACCLSLVRLALQVAAWFAAVGLARADVAGPAVAVAVKPSGKTPVTWWGQAAKAAGLPATPDGQLTRGQLTAFALEAAKEMETKLRAIPLTEPGAGAAIRALRPAWEAQAIAPDAKEPATVTQAQEIARLFQGRMAAADAARNAGRSGTSSGAARAPFSSPDAKPDLRPVTLARCYALIFFDLDNYDADDDGKTYAQEIAVGTDPFDRFNGRPRQFVIIEGENQTGPPGYFLPYPLTVRLKGENESIYVLTPVTFALAPDSPDWLCADARVPTPLVKSLTVRTDDLGYAWVYLKLDAGSDGSKSAVRITSP